MAFGHGDMLHAQIERDAMIFSTRGNWQAGLSWTVSQIGCGAHVCTLLDVKPGTPSGTHYIRSNALLSKSPTKARPGSTKQILDVTDIGTVECGQV